MDLGEEKISNNLDHHLNRHILTLVVKPAVASLGLPDATLVFGAIEGVIVSTQVSFLYLVL